MKPYNQTQIHTLIKQSTTVVPKQPTFAYRRQPKESKEAHQEDQLLKQRELLVKLGNMEMKMLKVARMKMISQRTMPPMPIKMLSSKNVFLMHPKTIVEMAKTAPYKSMQQTSHRLARLAKSLVPTMILSKEVRHSLQNLLKSMQSQIKDPMFALKVPITSSSRLLPPHSLPSQ